MRGKDDALLTRNTVPGESVYNEKRVAVDVSTKSLR
jgi:fibrillarin-like rRNA methylase